MADYTQNTNFAAKDSLLTGNPSKLVRGTELNEEFNRISIAILSKANTNSPALTGTPTAPTQSAGTNTTALATTQFVTTNFPSTNITFSGSNTYTGMQTFRDNMFEVVDNSDNTKKVALEVSGVTTGTTRTLTVPNKDGTIAVTSDLAAVSALSTNDNTLATGSYSATASSTVTVTTGSANTFAVGQEVFIAFNKTSGVGTDTLANNKFTIASIVSSTQFTINYGSTVTSSGNVTVERYGLMAVANAAEMTAGTSQIKAVTPKLYADSTLGVGQTWQLPTRVIGTSYQNTTGKPIQVCFSFEPSNNAGTTQITAEVSTNGTTWIDIIHTRNANDDDLNYGTMSFIVPNNTYYRITRGGNNIASSIWAELR